MPNKKWRFLFLLPKNSSSEVVQSTYDPMDEGSNPSGDKIAKNDAFFHDEKKFQLQWPVL
jgi:hypothetical protein